MRVSETTPARLPSGRHRIPDEEVRRNQRARLVEAVTELSVERGYANVVIADIVARAGVSKSTFYRFYRTKQECLFDAHKRHSAALIAGIDRSRAGGAPVGPERRRAGIRAALAHLGRHPQAGHLLSVGILSCGPRGADRHLVMIDALSSRLGESDVSPPSDFALAAMLFAAFAVTHSAFGVPAPALLEGLLGIADPEPGRG